MQFIFNTNKTFKIIFSIIKIKIESLDFSSNMVLLLSANVYSKILAVISGVLIGRWVNPADYGIWVALNVLPAYVLWSQIGTANGLGRELPLCLGSENIDRAKIIIGTAFTIHIIAIIFSMLLFPFIAIIFTQNPSPKWVHGIIFMEFSLGITLISGLFYIIGRSYRQFRSLSILIFCQTTISVFALWFVKHDGLYGLYYRMLISQLVILLGYLYYFRKFVIVDFSLREFRRLLKIGLPIFLAGYTALFFSIADRSIGALYLSPIELGVYGFSLFIFSGVQLLATSMCDVLFPEMVYDYGKHGSRIKLWIHVRRYWKIMLVTLPAPIIVLWLIIPTVLRLLVPKYTDAAEPAKILLLAAFIWSFVGILGNYLNSIGKAWSYSLCLAFSTLIFWIMCYVSVKLHYGIIGFAWSNVFSASIFLLCSWIISARAMKTELVENTIKSFK